LDELDVAVEGVHGETAAALTILGDAHAAKELWSEALDAYERATRKDPKQARGWFGKAAILARLKRNDEAAEAAAQAVAADKATQIAPKVAATWLQAGVIALGQGDLKGGEAKLRNASELAPKSAAASSRRQRATSRSSPWHRRRRSS